MQARIHDLRDLRRWCRLQHRLVVAVDRAHVQFGDEIAPGLRSLLQQLRQVRRRLDRRLEEQQIHVHALRLVIAGQRQLMLGQRGDAIHQLRIVLQQLLHQRQRQQAVVVAQQRRQIGQVGGHRLLRIQPQAEEAHRGAHPGRIVAQRGDAVGMGIGIGVEHDQQFHLVATGTQFGGHRMHDQTA